MNPELSQLCYLEKFRKNCSSLEFGSTGVDQIMHSITIIVSVCRSLSYTHILRADLRKPTVYAISKFIQIKLRVHFTQVY